VQSAASFRRNRANSRNVEIGFDSRRFKHLPAVPEWSDLISHAVPFGRLWYAGPDAVNNAIGYAEHRSRSHDALIRVYNDAGNVIQTHEHAGELKEWRPGFRLYRAAQGATRFQTPGRVGPKTPPAKTLLFMYHTAVWCVLAL
jgi:hypothetical protein